MAETDPERAVLWMARGAWVTMALRAGIELGVFDELDEARGVEEAGEHLGCDPPSLARLLRAFADLDLVEMTAPGTYRNTSLGACLTQRHPGRLCDLVLMQGLRNLSAWGALADAVRTGSGTYEQVHGRTSWEDLADDPEAQRRFNAAMARRASGQVAALLEGGDLPEDGTLVDVGGGRGAMLAELLGQRPRLRGILADQPAVAAEAESAFAAGGLGDRSAAVATDFFQAVPPGGDVYLLANVLHDWDDDDAVAILRSVRAAVPDHGRVLVVEHVLDAPGRSLEEVRDVHLVDLHMLVMFGARERSQAEYDVLFVRAGFTSSRLGGSGDWNVLEVRPVASHAS